MTKCNEELRELILQSLGKSEYWKPQFEIINRDIAKTHQHGSSVVRTVFLDLVSRGQIEVQIKIKDTIIDLDGNAIEAIYKSDYAYTPLHGKGKNFNAPSHAKKARNSYKYYENTNNENTNNEKDLIFK